MEICENMSKIQIDEEKDSEENSVSDDSYGKKNNYQKIFVCSQNCNVFKTSVQKLVVMVR